MKKSQPDFHGTHSPTLLIGAYSRVSTDEQANVIEGSLDNQRHRMQSFIEIKNMQEPGWGRLVEAFTDDGLSAKNTNRPAYQRLMKALQSGKINAVMVTELSRLSRNIPDFCDFHKILEIKGAKFLSIKEQFDTSTPAGKMMLYNMINLASFEREQISERVAINCHSRAQRGFLNGGPAILGYSKDPANKTTFTVNKSEAILVRRIFDAYLENRTLVRTIKAIEAEGIQPKVRSTSRSRLALAGKWTVGSLNSILQNKAYIGLREVNRVHQQKPQAALKSWQRFSVVPASWPGIVDRAVFEEVQDLLKNNREHERARLETSAARVFVASGLCFCGECGRRLVGQSAHGRSQIYRYYVHSANRAESVTCKFKRINADQIEAALGEHLTKILVMNGHFEAIEEKIRKAVAASPERLKVDKERLTSELKKIALAVRNTFRIQAELDAHSDAIRAVAAELEELGRKRKELETALESLRAREFAQSEVDVAVCGLHDRLVAFQKGWKKAPASMKKALMKDVVHSILITVDGIKIQYRLTTELNRNIGVSLGTEPSQPPRPAVELAKYRRLPPGGSDVDSEFHNDMIAGSQVVENGRG